eukprot:7345840-Karenia_brevis.AAC.1
MPRGRNDAAKVNKSRQRVSQSGRGATVETAAGAPSTSTLRAKRRQGREAAEYRGNQTPRKVGLRQVRGT